jgi:DNA-directed RNA polymerase subunit M/transcription elongation factor TFIIS
MEIQKCPKCGSEMKLIPAGISKKTGKPYKAFFSCKNCGYTMNVPDDIANKVNKEYPRTSYKSPADLEKERAERIQALHNEKRDDIKDAVAWKLATVAVFQNPVYKDSKIAEQREAIKSWQNWYYMQLTQQGEEKEAYDNEEDNDDLMEFDTQEPD